MLVPEGTTAQANFVKKNGSSRLDAPISAACAA
jgi:hypothetical protein